MWEGSFIRACSRERSENAAHMINTSIFKNIILLRLDWGTSLLYFGSESDQRTGRRCEGRGGEGRRPRERVKTKENTQRWYGARTRHFNTQMLTVQHGKKNPPKIEFLKRKRSLPAKQILTRWKLRPHLTPHLPHIPASVLMISSHTVPFTARLLIHYYPCCVPPFPL